MKTILITGGTSGIGYALARKLHQEGHRVLIVSSRTHHPITEALPGTKLLTADLSDPTAADQLATQCRDQFPDLSLLIHCAGVQYTYDWLTTPENRMAEEITVNLTSPLQLTHGLLPVLIRQPEAAVVFVSSALIYGPKRTAPVYCGTKAAIHQTAMALRYQLEGTSVRVVELIPPLVDTPMTAGRGSGKMPPDELADKFWQKFRQKKTTIRIGKARLLYFLYRLAPTAAERIMKHGA